MGEIALNDWLLSGSRVASLNARAWAEAVIRRDRLAPSRFVRERTGRL